MAEQSIIAYRYKGTFAKKRSEVATLERLGDFTTFDIPPEWLPDDVEDNSLVQVECDKPGGVFAITVVEGPEGAENFDESQELDVE